MYLCIYVECSLAAQLHNVLAAHLDNVRAAHLVWTIGCTVHLLYCLYRSSACTDARTELHRDGAAQVVMLLDSYKTAQ